MGNEPVKVQPGARRNLNECTTDYVCCIRFLTCNITPLTRRFEMTSGIYYFCLLIYTSAHKQKSPKPYTT
jgi:hypothetical protein